MSNVFNERVLPAVVSRHARGVLQLSLPDQSSALIKESEQCRHAELRQALVSDAHVKHAVNPYVAVCDFSQSVPSFRL